MKVQNHNQTAPPPRLQKSKRRSIFTYIAGLDSSAYLFMATVIAIIFANTSIGPQYFAFLNIPIVINIAGFDLLQVHGHTMTVGTFINDALMALFFFTIGLEIKHEMMEGSLSDLRKALLPVIAAMGGMAIPVLVYLAIAHEAPENLGVAIPMATDIAFSLAVLALLGSRVPTTLKVFLMTLAVADDIGGIIVIAVFYTSGIDFLALAMGILMAGIAFYLGRTRVRALEVYYMLFFFCWLFFLHSGVHATIAGVLMGLAIPHKPLTSREELREKLRWMSNELDRHIEPDLPDNDFMKDDLLAKVFGTKKTLTRTYNLSQAMMKQVEGYVNYLILPLFAFANAGVKLGAMEADALFGVPLAIALGLLLGKTFGIFGATWIAVKVGVAKMPERMTTKNLFGLSMFGGIGFTVALFLAALAFNPKSLGAEGDILLNQARMGVLLGSILSGVIGYFTLKHILKKEATSYSADEVTTMG